jgi:hypothetical protein
MEFRSMILSHGSCVNWIRKYLKRRVTRSGYPDLVTRQSPQQLAVDSGLSVTATEIAGFFSEKSALI